MPICARCNEDNPERARFCLNCASPLHTSSEVVREVRKVVTLVFTDVSGSTAMGEALDPESLRRVMARYFGSMKIVIERHGGVVEKFVGDAVMAVFGIPVLHEDDALRGVRAAEEMRSVLGELNKEFERQRGITLKVRSGVNTGEVVAGDHQQGEGFVTGDAVNIAARLEQSAPVGEILLGPQTYRLVKNAVEVEPVPPLRLKGKSDLLPAYRLISVRGSAPAFARRLDSPLIGRKHELELLHQAFERSVRERSCHLFTIFGSAGIGKSRLVAEFLGEVAGSAHVVEGRCLAYGEGITYWPLAEIIRDAANLTEDLSLEETSNRLMKPLASAADSERVSTLLLRLLGLEQGPVSTDELAWAVRRMLETMAETSPLVVMLDDIHWAEPALLDTIGYIADWSRDSPIFFLCVARPELLDSRSDWGGGKMNATSLLLEPLTPAEASCLAGALLGGAGLSDEVKKAVSEAAEGNPLFVEQLLEMMIDEGRLVAQEDGWSLKGAVDDLKVPPTIDALISARLDTLADGERQVIERAAVIGKSFSIGALRHLSPDDSGDGIADHLMSLVRKELLRLGEGGSGGAEFKFRHALIRDAAYDSISKEQRADMHLRIAEQIERTASVEAVGTEELLAHHLSQAHGYKAALGSPPEELWSIATRAAEHYGLSGQSALDRSDYRAADKLLRRGLELVNDPLQYASLALALADVLYEQGRFDEGLVILSRVTTADEVANAKAEIMRTSLLLLTGTLTASTLQEVAQRTISLFEDKGDLRWAARSWMLLVHLYNTTVEGDKQLAAAEHALAAAVAAGDRQIELAAREELCFAHSHGFTPVIEVLAFCDEQRKAAPDSMRLEGFLLAVEGHMRSLIGDFDAARRDTDKAIELREELGMSLAATLGRNHAAWVELRAGDHEAAYQRLVIIKEEMERYGEVGYLSTIMAQMADVLCELGRYAEAETAALHSRDITGVDDVDSMAGWRAALARVLIARGEKVEAKRLLEEAAEIIVSTESWDRGDFKVQAAKVHLAAGEPAEARRWFADARQDYERKGATSCVADVDALIASLEAG